MKKKHLNTRLVVVEPVNEDTLKLTLYYGNQRVESAHLAEVKNATHQDLLTGVEYFRMYGMEEQQ